MADFKEIMELQPWFKSGINLNGIIRISVETILGGWELKN